MTKKTGGRPRKTKGLIDVARWMPQIRRVCSRQLVLNQLDALERDHTLSEGRIGIKHRIAQIKKDVASIKL
mgnify:FL=1